MAVTLRVRKMDLALGSASSSYSTQRLYGASHWSYWVKKALVDAGWVVYYSSDGLSISSADLWTSPTFQAAVSLGTRSNAQATSLGRDVVWCCLRSPMTDANGDYLHICLNPTQSVWANALTTPTDASAMVITGPFLNGDNMGYLRIGMTLSSSLVSFSGGAAYASTSLTTARGLLPAATGATWSLHNIGCGGTGNPSVKTLAILTEGNQFHIVMTYENLAYCYKAASRYFYSLMSLTAGGYAVTEGSLATTTSAISSGAVEYGLHSGSNWLQQPVQTTATQGGYYATQLGGYRSAYVKRVGGVVYGGGVSVSEPQGSGYYLTASAQTVPSGYSTKLKFFPCSGIYFGDLGLGSDFILFADVAAAQDRTYLADTVAGSKYLIFRGSPSICLKWDFDDNPARPSAVGVA